MKIFALCLSLAVGVIIFSGCAGYNIQPTSATNMEGDWASNKLDNGYVFYQPELYFLVAPNPPLSSKGTNDTSTTTSPSVTVTPIYLPNTAKPYRVTTYNFLAKSGFTFNFSNGWQLTSISDQSDNSTVVSSLTGQLGSALGAAFGTKAIGADKPKKTFLLHPLYSDHGIITGFDSVDVPVTPPKKKS